MKLVMTREFIRASRPKSEVLVMMNPVLSRSLEILFFRTCGLELIKFHHARRVTVKA